MLTAQACCLPFDRISVQADWEFGFWSARLSTAHDSCRVYVDDFCKWSDDEKWVVPVGDLAPVSSVVPGW